ncbi:hypothetical protein GGI02_001018 [Coemansia sp. RSA 2322]|nr:hypothetical protein GGI02_001018 [Coemansia sp. RSA 2322]
MGRLSLAIGRHREHSDGRGGRSKHFRSSLKGLLGIPSSERASVDLGDLGEQAEEHAAAALKQAPAAVAVAAPDSGSGEEGAGSHGLGCPGSDADSPGAAVESAARQPEAASSPEHIHAGATAAASATATLGENGGAAAAAAPDVLASEQAALERYSMSTGADTAEDGDDKHSWRRRGSLLTSRLGGSRQQLPRKESTPQFSVASTPQQHKTPHGLFHRSESGDGASKSTSFWRSGSTLRSSVYAADANAPPSSSETTTASATAPERTHRSSSVPFLAPIPASAKPSSASPYLRAIASGAASNPSRLNRKDLSVSLASSRHAADRFPRLSMAGSPHGCSPPGSPSHLSLALRGDGASAAASSATPMTFLVSPRPRASTGSRHGISAVPHHTLARISTDSREFGVDKHSLSAATVPALELLLPGSPRVLSGGSVGVDLSEFGVAAANSSTMPASVCSAKHLALLPPSPASTTTPPCSIESASASAAFGPLHEEAEDCCSVLGDDTPPLLSHSSPPAAKRQTPSAATKSSDAVHETHHMEVLHDPHTGRKMINQYMIIRELGRGTHGKVKLAFDTVTGGYYAIKVIDKESRDRRLRPNAPSAQRSDTPGSRAHRHDHRRSQSHGFLRIDVDKMERVKREIAILKKCRHPNVVRLREVIDDAHARRIYLVIEYMDGGEIAWRDANNLPVMTPDEARSVFRDLVLGVEYLHYVGILHRDLKPQNLLHNKAGTVKISDFGVSFLSRRMSKRKLSTDSTGGAATGGPRRVAGEGQATSPSNPQPDSVVPSLSGSGPLVRTRSRVLRAGGADVKAPSPLRPAGRAAALQGSPLHRFASQPVMNSSSVSPRLPAGPVLRRQGSALSRASLSLACSESSSEVSSLHSQHSQQRATMGMTDEFGRRKASLPAPSSRPYIESPLSSPVSAISALPECKLPPEILSTDANVYDPFDSSDSDEFFPQSSAESESDYGGHFARDNENYEDGASSDDDSEEGGIVFGALPPKPKPRMEVLHPGDDTTSDVASTASDRPRHQRKGTLGDITVSFDEKDDERELAKTAGTPAFFAPELCCTVEELTKVLKDERARRQAHSKLVSRHRHNTDPAAAALPETQQGCESAAPMAESERRNRRTGGLGGGGLRPSSLYIEKSATTSVASGGAPLLSLGVGAAGQAKSTKRHSTFASLLARPFSPKSPKSRLSTASSNTPAHNASPLDSTDDELLDQSPLSANVITPAIDIWAMGVTLYCLIYGRVPFRASTEFELFNIIPRQPLEFPNSLEVVEEESNELLFNMQQPPTTTTTSSNNNNNLPSSVRQVQLPPPDADLCDLLSRLLDKDFRTRITIEELKQHPWVVRDLDHPSSWVLETDPTLRPSLKITSQEVAQAVVPKVHTPQQQQRGFRASVRRRISMLSPLTSKGSNQQRQRQRSSKGVAATATKAKSSLDWLKIWQ